MRRKPTANVEHISEAGTYTIRFNPGGVYHAITEPVMGGVEIIWLLTGVHRRECSGPMFDKLVNRAQRAISKYNEDK